ncbi:hypothetical protein THRCLA_21718 [Thraustotheca clavata]|uniref:Uncharacterized protein n=1 Tax=Thraustotheca clavata TaxID=74557 RepID=A0A1V9ZQC6_9STRA|nr:hypothetical protein THRCLA_21718 [Thraustotheca clavata]
MILIYTTIHPKYDSTTVDPPQPQRRHPKRFRITPKQELDYLKAKQIELTAQLSELKAKLDREFMADNPWKIRAAKQAQLAQKAKLENERLRHLLENQLRVVDAIEQVLEKRPRISQSVANNVQLGQAVLGVENRQESLEYIMQCQLDKLETEWINYGIHNAVEQQVSMSNSFVVPMQGDEFVQVNFIRCAPLSLNFMDMADIVWHYNTVDVPAVRKILTKFHSNLVYFEDTLELTNSTLPKFRGHIAGRRWDEDNRVVITWRSILDDKLQPTTDDEIVENRMGWTVIYRVNANTSFIAVLMKVSADLTPLSFHKPPSPGAFTEHILRLSIDEDLSIDSLCDFLGDTTTATAAAPPQPRRRGTRRYRITPKQELDYLKAKQIELTAKLADLKAKQDRELLVENPWKIRATKQAQFAQKARQENERLRILLEGQLKVVDAIEQMLEKRLKISECITNSVQLDHAVLGIHNRLEDLEYIMKCQYDRLDTEWILNDMYKTVEQRVPVSKAFMVPVEGDEVAQMKYIRCEMIPLSFTEMADLLWHYSTVEVPRERQVLTKFHSNLVYYQDKSTLINPTLPSIEARVVGRRWDEEDRVVMTWRSILDDKLYPNSQSQLIENRIAWTVLYRVGLNSSFFSVFMKTSAIVNEAVMNNEQPTPGTFTELLLRLYDDTSESFGAIMQARQFFYKLAGIDNHTSSFDFLSDFLADISDSATSELAKAPIQTHGKRRRPTPREELDYLKVKQFELQNQLQKLQLQQTLETTDSDSWKARAIAQAQFAQKAKHENARLKSIVEEQLKMIEGLEHLILKRPKISNLTTDEMLWKQAILGHENRYQDLLSLMQFQYEKLETEWIRHDLYNYLERGDSVHKSFVQGSSDDETMDLNFIRCNSIPLDFRVMADILWEHTSRTIPNVHEVLEVFDPYLVYSREDMEFGHPFMPILEARVAGCRWIEEDRVVFAWRSILEDKLIPHNERNLIDNRSGWQTGPNKCYVSAYSKLTTPIFPVVLKATQPPVGTITELLLQTNKANSEQYGAIMKKAVMAKMNQKDLDEFTE